MKEFILEYWLESLFGLLVAGMGYFLKIGKKKIKEQDLIKMGMMALLRNEIVRAYNEYTHKGYCPIYGKENIESLYKQYHALGGNGTVTDLYEKVIDLPTNKSDVYG